MKKSNIISIVLVSITLLIAAFLFKKYRIAPAIEIYSVQIESLEQGKFDWNQTMGKPVFIQFFGTYCGECRAELPLLSILKDSIPESEMKYMLISDEAIEVIRSFKNHVKPDFEMFHSVTPLKQVNIFTYPTTYVLNKKGHVVYKATNAQNWSDPKVIELLRKNIYK